MSQASATDKTPTSRTKVVSDSLRNYVLTTARTIKTVELGVQLMWMFISLLFILISVVLFEHWIWPLNSVARYVIWFAMIAISGYLLIRYILPLALRPIHPAYAARRIEQTIPEMKNSLINWFELSQSTDGVPRGILANVGRQANKYLNGQDANTLVDHAHLIRLGALLFGMLLMGSIYLAVAPKNGVDTIRRILFPWASITSPSRVKIISVTPGDAVVTQGTNLNIQVELNGIQASEPVFVQFETADGQLVDQRVRMDMEIERLSYHLEFGKDFGGIHQPMHYSIVAGDAQKGPFRIEVRAVPLVAIDEVRYEYPKYMQLNARVAKDDGRIEAPEGTRVTIHATANQPMSKARIEFNPIVENGKFIRAASVGDLSVQDRSLTGSWVLELDEKKNNPTLGSYRVRATNELGHWNEQPVVYPTKIIADMAPEIEVRTALPSPLVVAVNDQIKVETRAIDPDFGLRKVRIVARQEKRELVAEQLFTDETGSLGQVVREYSISPTTLRLRPGDQFEIVAIAEDNRHHPGQDTLEPNIVESAPVLVTVAEPDKALQSQAGPKPAEGDQESPSEKDPNPENAKPPIKNPDGDGDNNKQPSTGTAEDKNSSDPKQDSPNNPNAKSKDPGKNAANAQPNKKPPADKNNPNSNAKNKSEDGSRNPNTQSPQDGNKSKDTPKNGNQNKNSQAQNNSKSPKNDPKKDMNEPTPGESQKSSGEGQEVSAESSSSEQNSDQNSASSSSNSASASGNNSSEANNAQSSAASKSSGQQSAKGQESRQPEHAGDAFEAIEQFMNEEKSSESNSSEDSTSKSDNQPGSSAKEQSQGEPNSESNSAESATDNPSSQPQNSNRNSSAKPKSGQSNQSKNDATSKEQNSPEPNSQDNQGEGNTKSSNENSKTDSGNNGANDNNAPKGQQASPTKDSNSSNQKADPKSNAAGEPSENSVKPDESSKGTDAQNQSIGDKGPGEKGTENKGSAGSDTDNNNPQMTDKPSPKDSANPKDSNSKSEQPKSDQPPKNPKESTNGQQSKGSENASSNNKDATPKTQGSQSSSNDKNSSASQKKQDENQSKSDATGNQGSPSEDANKDQNKGSPSSGDSSSKSGNPQGDQPKSGAPGDKSGAGGESSDNKDSEQSADANSEKSTESGTKQSSDPSQEPEGTKPGNKNSADENANTGKQGQPSGDKQGSGSGKQGQGAEGNKASQPKDGNKAGGESPQGDKTAGGAEKSDAQQPGGNQQQPGAKQAGSSGNPDGKSGSSTKQSGEAGKNAGSSSAAPTSGSANDTAGDDSAPAPNQADPANLEYARKASDMVLDYLDRQRDQPDPRLLKKLKWTPDDLRTFVDRWKKAKQDAEKDPNKRHEFEESLRSLGLIPQSARNKAVSGKDDALRGMQEEGSRVRPPDALREQFDSFRRALQENTPKTPNK